MRNYFLGDKGMHHEPIFFLISRKTVGLPIYVSALLAESLRKLASYVSYFSNFIYWTHYEGNKILSLPLSLY